MIKLLTSTYLLSGLAMRIRLRHLIPLALAALVVATIDPFLALGALFVLVGLASVRTALVRLPDRSTGKVSTNAAHLCFLWYAIVGIWDLLLWKNALRPAFEIANYVVFFGVYSTAYLAYLLGVGFSLWSRLQHLRLLALLPILAHLLRYVLSISESRMLGVFDPALSSLLVRVFEVLVLTFVSSRWLAVSTATRPFSTRKSLRRLLALPFAVLLALSAFSIGAPTMLAYTDWSEISWSELASQQFSRRYRGRLVVDAVLPTNISRELRMVGVRLYGPGGREYARVDTMSFNYRWADLFLGNVVLANVTLARPVVRLSKSEERWNISDVFRRRGPAIADRSPAEASGGRRIVLRDVLIRSGAATIRVPHEPNVTDPSSSRWHLERTSDGWQRVYRIERINASLPLARVVEAPDDPGRLFMIAQLSCRATIIGEAVEIEQLRGDVKTHSDTLFFQVWEANLANSRVFGQGLFTLSGKPTLDLTVSGNPVATNDASFLLPNATKGISSFDLRVRSKENRTALQFENVRWESPEVAFSGRLAIDLESAKRGFQFGIVQIQVERLDAALARRLAPGDSPSEISEQDLLLFLLFGGNP